MKKTEYVKMFPADIEPAWKRKKRPKWREVMEAALLIGLFFGCAYVWVIVAAMMGAE